MFTSLCNTPGFVLCFSVQSSWQWNLQIELDFDVLSAKPVAGHVTVSIPELQTEQTQTVELRPVEGRIVLLVSVNKVRGWFLWHLC